MFVIIPFVIIELQSLGIKALLVLRAIINQKAKVLQSEHMHIPLECIIVKGIV